VAGMAAAFMAGCSGSRPVVRECVDSFGNILPDIECRRANSRGVVMGHYGVPSTSGGGGYAGGGGGYGGGGSSVGSVSRGGFGGASEGFGGGFGGG
jgi:hypothetical protein